MANLYDNIDKRALLKKAEPSLFRYGGDFLPMIITKAQGTHIYTAEGQKLLDFTSGHISSLIGHGDPEMSARLLLMLPRSTTCIVG